MAPQYESEKDGKFSEQNELNGLQISKFKCPKHWNPSVSSNSEVGWIPLSHYWPSGVIRNGSPVWSSKRWKNFRTKLARWTANGPVWMPQALKSTCLIQFWSWVNSTFPLLALWGNKKWLPSMKVKKLKNFQNKIGWTGCILSSLNTRGPEALVYHSSLTIGLKGTVHHFPEPCPARTRIFVITEVSFPKNATSSLLG